MDWIECQDCGEEFKVISSSVDLVEFCPFCGSAVELELEEEDDEDDY